MEFSDSFDVLKSELKKKWIDYYAGNREWIEQLDIYRDVNSSENLRAGSHYFLLGALSVLEPSLPGILQIFGKLNPDAKHIAKVLEVFDLDLNYELDKRTTQSEIIPLLLEANLKAATSNGHHSWEKSREEIER